MDGQILGGVDGSHLVDGLTNDVDDTAESTSANGHLNGSASVNDTLASDETLSGIEGNGAHVVTTQMLGDLQHESAFDALDLEGVENGGQVTLELHIDDGTNDLRDLATSETSYKKISYNVPLQMCVSVFKS